MPTKNPRINVALEKPIYSLIEKLAEQRGLSLSMVTRDLLREALEIHGDAILSSVAEERESTFTDRKALTPVKFGDRGAIPVPVPSRRQRQRPPQNQ